MNLLEQAIMYATQQHEGDVRKLENIPYILHPLEVAQIISTMTEDQEVIAAGVLHDVVEDTDGTIDEIRTQFGDRVATIVLSETENKYPGQDKSATWKRRKEETLSILKHSTDIGIKMMWLADKLANIRSLSRRYNELGEDIWESFHQKDPMLHCWYYKSVAELVEYDLNRTGAFKEYIQHINYLWPGTFDSEKARYRKYKEVSIDGCRLIGHGSKGDVYRYDDELIIKVYNADNTYRDVENEIAASRKAFIMGLPTAISFGIVAVGKRYGAMYEMLGTLNISQRIAREPRRVGYFAKIMAELAHKIHDTEADEDCFPKATKIIKERIEEGITSEYPEIGKRLLALVDKLPDTRHIVHGDFHTGNVVIQNGEPLMIDMDRIALGDPIVDLSGIYMSYVANGEFDPESVRKYMGFSYETALEFYRVFMENYLGDGYEARIDEVTDKTKLLCYARMIRQLKRKQSLTDEETALIHTLAGRLDGLLDRVTDLRLDP